MTSNTTNKFSREVRALRFGWFWITRASTPRGWAAVTSIAAKIGCTPQTLHDWVKKTEVDRGQRAGVPTDMANKLKALGRTASFGRPMRSYARQALILRWRSRSKP